MNHCTHIAQISDPMEAPNTNTESVMAPFRTTESRRSIDVVDGAALAEVRAAQIKALRLITCAYHCALSFGVRRCVAKSLYTMPNRRW